MTVNPLPPQAYTKEILQKAYAWLLTQNTSVKDMATTQDMLVSMYLKTQRGGESALETPSIQNFKLELKNLASMMGDLQTGQQTPPTTNPPTTAPSVVAQVQTSVAPQPAAISAVHGIPHQIVEPTVQAATAPPQAIPLTAPQVQTTPTMPPTNNGNGLSPFLSFSLDQHSQQMLIEVKCSLNLSTDAEALRALIALGYRQFKKM